MTITNCRYRQPDKVRRQVVASMYESLCVSFSGGGVQKETGSGIVGVAIHGQLSMATSAI